ncbi:hypothetical protein Ptr902_05602 [Pyrenophora tritici-repentis]|nr:hypothetical protein Ptr902_05602 [Pyrenophora tritici-repentis]
MLSLVPLIGLLRLATAQSFIVLDTGLSQSSTSILQWPTSLRRLAQGRSNNTTLTQFKAEANTSPIGAQALAYSPSFTFLFSATGQGIIRTSLDCSSSSTILSSNQIPSLTIAETEQKTYYSDPSTFSIQKADFNGETTQLVRNIAQGTNLHATGIVVDKARGWIYWTAASSSNNNGATATGSLFRAALNGTDNAQLLVNGITAAPGQLRIVVDSLFWLENTASTTNINRRCFGW